MPSSPPTLTLYLTGPFAARDGAGTDIAGLSRRGQALLAVLSRQPGMRAERGYLADLLWSDRSEQQSRASLRQELSVLKRNLPGGVLESDRQMVRLDPARVGVETHRPGEFLQGFDLASEGFEDWLRRCRAETFATEPPPAQPAGRGDRPSLAVLAFDEIGAPETDMFADGVVEEITAALSRVRDFHVIARQSAFALKDERLAVPEIARRLGTAYLVEGSVRRSGDRVRISVQLVDGSDGRNLWSERFDDRQGDLFALQDRIAEQVAGQIAPNLRLAEIARAASTPPAARSAYDLVLTALPHFWAHRKEDNVRAIALFDAALAHDPDYAHALAMKAWCHAQQACYAWSDDPAAERRLAISAADRAERLAGDNAPALTAICAALSLTTAGQERPMAIIARALALDPNNAWGWLRSGWVHCLHNQPKLALDHFARAEALSPLDPFLFNVQFGKANAHAELGDLPRAVELVKSGLNMAPGVTWAYRMLAAYYGQMGDREKSRETLEIYFSHYPGLTIEKLRASMPPAIFATQTVYVAGLRAAGIPEK
jgi:TolB-like protein